MKATDIKVMTEDQLADEILKLKKEQFNLRFQKATGQLENTSRVRAVRRQARNASIAHRSIKAVAHGRPTLIRSTIPSLPA